MTKTKEKETSYLTLRILKPEDITEQAMSWYKDRDVVSFSDNQYRDFTFDSQREYVKTCFDNNDIDLYGIFAKNMHIGNISISGLDSWHKRAEISYLIGEKSYWNKGVASFAIAEIIKKSREIYQLNKLFAGLAHENIASKIVLEKNGFILEGIRKSHLFYNNTFYDQLDYGLLLA